MKIIKTKKLNFISSFEYYDEELDDYYNCYLYEAVVDTIPKENKFILHDESENNYYNCILDFILDNNKISFLIEECLNKTS